MLIHNNLPLPLPLTSEEAERREAPSAPRALGKAQPPSSPARPSAPMDKLLSTADVVEITGHHRCTIYRWVKAGTFPPKRGGGGRGWLRSDVEEWLRSGAVAPHEFAVSRRL